MKELKELLDEKSSQLRKITDERDLLNDKLEEEKKERADQVRSLIKAFLDVGVHKNDYQGTVGHTH